VSIVHEVRTSTPADPSDVAGDQTDPGDVRRRPPVRTVLPVVLMAGVYLAVARLASFPLSNYDTYFHLRFGHEFLTGHWSLRHPGSVSTFATADWVPTQWLPQVVMAQTEQWFGLAGVAWLCGLLFLSLAMTVYWACRREAEPLVAVLLAFLTLVACTPGMSMRPQQVSYILVTVTTAAWLQARRTGRAPWLLVPVTWAWTMCHGMWPVGIVIGLAAVAGLALDRRHPRSTLLRMLAVPVLSAVASLLTPVGPRLFPAVLQVNSRGKYFYEWGSPDFTEFYAVVLLAILALAIGPRLRRGERAPWFDLVLVGLAALWAVYSLRTVPVSACMAAPLAAAALQPSLGARPKVRRPERVLVVAGYVVALAGLALVVPHSADQPRETPSWVDPALGDLPPGTVVLDDSAFGGYLMWRFPQLDVVMSGYGDIYTDDELERNADIDAVRGRWVELVKETHADYAILPPGSALAYNLRQVEHWRVEQVGGDLELLAPPPGWYDS
jgi:hypothetical protein